MLNAGDLVRIPHDTQLNNGAKVRFSVGDTIVKIVEATAEAAIVELEGKIYSVSSGMIQPATIHDLPLVKQVQLEFAKTFVAEGEDDAGHVMGLAMAYAKEFLNGIA